MRELRSIQRVGRDLGLADGDAVTRFWTSDHSIWIGLLTFALLVGLAARALRVHQARTP